MAPLPLGRRLRNLVVADGGLPLIWIALTCFALYPVWRARLLPMLDTPNHLGLARGWHEYNDPASRVAEGCPVDVSWLLITPDVEHFDRQEPPGKYFREQIRWLSARKCDRKGVKC